MAFWYVAWNEKHNLKKNNLFDTLTIWFFCFLWFFNDIVYIIPWSMLCEFHTFFVYVKSKWLTYLTFLKEKDFFKCHWLIWKELKIFPDHPLRIQIPIGTYPNLFFLLNVIYITFIFPKIYAYLFISEFFYSVFVLFLICR